MIFLPAILIVSFAFFIRVIQYEPLYPKQKKDKGQSNEQITQIPIYPGDPILGNKKAATTIMVFEDFGCEACAEQMETLRLLIEEHPKQVKIVWKSLPVTRIPISSEMAHQYGYCANKQNKFSAFEKLVFDNNFDLSEGQLVSLAESAELNEKKLKECLVSTEMQNYQELTNQLARALNIQSVPAVFLNHVQIQPPDSLSSWEALLGL